MTIAVPQWVELAVTLSWIGVVVWLLMLLAKWRLR
jgi:hypothetical protein